MSRSRARLTHSLTALVAVCAALTASMFAGIGVSAADDSASGITAVGRLDRFPKDSLAAFGKVILPTDFEANKRAFGGSLLGVPQRGELWQIYPTSDDLGVAKTLIAIRHMDTLAIKGTIRIDAPLYRLTASLGGDWFHTFDGDRRIFFVHGGRQFVLEINLETHEQKRYALGPPVLNAGRPLTSFAPGGFAYDPFENSILLMVGGVVGGGAGNTNTFVYRLALDTGGSGTTRVLRSCNGPLPASEGASTLPVEPLFTEQNVYFPCQRAGSIGAVVRVPRADLMSASSAEDLVVGPAFLEAAMADPVSGRIFMVTLGGEIWALDTETMAFVGVVSAAAESGGSPKSGYGFDKVTGRLYFLSSTYGLGVAEGRYFPIPQARTISKGNALGQERIVSDPVSGRFFVMVGRAATRESFYTIYQAGAASQPPPPADPDQSTVDMAEKEGVTDSRYFASGTGYGFRTLLAKGIVTVPPAPTAGQVSPTGGIINDHVNSKCGYTDRELVGARVAKAEYDSGSTSAVAVGVNVDDRTKVDLEHIHRCDIAIEDGQNNEVFEGFYSTSPTADVLKGNENTADPAAYKWTAQGASCSSSDGGETVSNESVNDSSETDCPKPGKELKASATAKFEGSVSVGRTETKTTIKRTSAGVVSEVVAEAADVKIGDIPGMGAVSIGELTAKATSRSNGRPNRRDMSSHSVTISGVRVGATTICVSNCVIDEVARRLTTLAGGKADFRTVSGLDPDLLRGTPKGALTAVQKSVSRQASDQALVGDFTTEVPALEVLVYNDNGEFGRARQLYQFAGVATAATYNIALLPGGAGFDDDPGAFDEDALSPSGGLDGILPGVGGGGTSPIASMGRGDGDSIIERVVRALARGIRMFFSNPRHALLLLTAWALLTLPPFLSRRRRLLAAARSA